MVEVEAVYFDLDGTLCVLTLSDEEIYEAIFDRVEVPRFFDLDHLATVDYEDLPDTNSDREHHENVYRAVARNVGEEPSHAPALAEATVEVLDSTTHTFRDGAKESLEYVREKYPVGLITAGSEESQRPKLETLGIQDTFDVIVYCGSGSGIKCKPDSDPFEIAMDELGTSPERSIYIGNRHDGDVVGPHRIGMQTAWVPDNDVSTNPEPAPTYRLSSMHEIRDIL